MTSSSKRKKYSYDISLDEGAGAHLISWITGLMVFFATLTLAVNFALSSVTKSWVTGLFGTLTVEIKPPLSTEGEGATAQSQQRFDDSIRQVLIMLKNNPSVREARLLTEPEIRKLIEPWVGHDVTVDAIPLPALIDVKLTPDADVSRLQGALKAIEPSASVDSHTDTLNDVKMLVNTVTLFMLLLTGVIGALAVITISGIVRSKFTIHRSEVETLHLIGASDEYIARQFRQHTLRGTLKGATAGLAATVVLLLATGLAPHTVEGNIVPHLQLLPMHWALLLLLPILASSLIAHLTAQATVLKELSRLP